MIVINRDFKAKVYQRNFFLLIDAVMILSGIFILFGYFTVGTVLFLVSTSELTKYYFDRKKRIFADSIILSAVYLWTLEDVSMILSWFLVIMIIANMLNLLLKKNTEDA